MMVTFVCWLDKGALTLLRVVLWGTMIWGLASTTPMWGVLLALVLINLGTAALRARVAP